MISVQPIGYVVCATVDPGDPAPVSHSLIRVLPEYLPALHRIEEHSHIWVLCWFHQAPREKLQARPKVSPGQEPFGVFGLRTPPRPNPIALTAVRLDRVEGDTLHVTGLDAFEGTPVLDLKPYYELDIIFSPRTPYIRPANAEARRKMFYKQALAHHGEACPCLELGVAMAMLADERLGQIQDAGVTLCVEGSPCLADVLQGLTRARLANPPRFSYSPVPAGRPALVTWQKDGLTLRISGIPGEPPVIDS